MAEETVTESAAADSLGTLDTGAETTTESDDTAPEAEAEPELFMSPNAQRLKAAQQEAKHNTGDAKRMAGSVRAKLEADIREKIEADTPWVKGLSAQDGANVRKLYDLGEQNPLALVDALVQKMASSPLHRSQIESYLQHFYQPPKPDADAEPGPDIPTSESAGKPVVYSAEQQRKWGEWQKRQILAESNKAMAPLLQDHQQRQTDQQTERENTAYRERVKQTQFSRPGFQENAAAIQAAFNAAPRPWNTDGVKRSGRELEMLEEHLLAESYHGVMIKAARDEGAKKFAADLKVKQVGTGGVTGTGSAATATEAGPPKNMRESMRRVMKKNGWGA